MVQEQIYSMETAAEVLLQNMSNQNVDRKGERNKANK
jgi:hypothetical protein